MQGGKADEAFRIVGSQRNLVRGTISSEIVRSYADRGDFRDAEQWAKKATSEANLGRRLAYIAARAACASSADAQWIVIFYFERDLARFPESASAYAPPVCQRAGKG